MNAKTISSKDTYIDKAVKLIPAEVLPPFVAAASAIEVSDLGLSIKTYFFLAVVLSVAFAFVPTILAKLYAIPVISGWRQHLIASTGFILWSANTSYDSFPKFTENHSEVRLTLALLLIAFTAIVPLLVNPKGE